MREKAETVVAPPIFMPPEPPKAEGTAFVKRWKGKVTDFNTMLVSIQQGKLPPTLITVNQSVLDSLAKANKNTLTIPGVEFVEETLMSSRIR